MDDAIDLQNFIEFDQKTNTLRCKGEWNLKNIATLRKIINKKDLPAANKIEINGKQITKLDSAGAWMMLHGIASATGEQVEIKLESFSEQQQKLFALMEQKKHKKSPPKKKAEPVHLNWVQQIGKYGLSQSKEFQEYLHFIGKLFFDGMRVFTNVTLWRWNAVVSVVNKSGAQALPIIGLLSFMIGVVIAYQIGHTLKEYGADIFIVDFLGLSILREFGPLITAIMVGGRTGSAFTAQIGIMKINLEVDALTTMGVKVADLLLLPRLLGLFIVVPLLTIWADVFGVLGGMIMTKSMMHISWYDFLVRFEQQIPLRSLTIGLLKAPVYALIIASVGCFEGMKVHGSAESVGIRTTKSVVLAIFFIIVFDSIVSVLLSRYDL